MRTRSPSSGALLITAALVLGACARAVVTAPPERPPTAPAIGAEHRGLASWYGQKHQGKRTASGEVFDMHELTAAHRTLPMGTRVMVTNLENGRAVEVRINDRGPFVDGRVLDLSYGAARVIGASGAGVVRVSFRVVSLPDTVTDAKSTGASTGGPFSLQLAAFTSRARAESLRRSLAREGAEPTVSESTVGGQHFYRVRLGPYANRGAADTEAKRLAERGYFSVVVTEP